MIGRPPRPTRTDTLVPSPTLFRSAVLMTPTPLMQVAVIVSGGMAGLVLLNTEVEARHVALGIDVGRGVAVAALALFRSEEHTSELQSLMRISYAVFCLKKKNENRAHQPHH